MGVSQKLLCFHIIHKYHPKCSIHPWYFSGFAGMNSHKSQLFEVISWALGSMDFVFIPLEKWEPIFPWMAGTWIIVLNLDHGICMNLWIYESMFMNDSSRFFMESTWIYVAGLNFPALSFFVAAEWVHVLENHVTFGSLDVGPSGPISTRTWSEKYHLVYLT